MNIDVYTMIETQRAELDRAVQRRARLSEVGVMSGPSLMSRVAGLVRRVVSQERVVQPKPSSIGQIYCLTTRPYEPV